MNLFTFLLACSPDNYIAPVQKELAVSPSLLEVEGVNVGDSKEFTLQLDNLAGGEISIRNVNLLPVDGDGFRVQSWDEFIPTGGHTHTPGLYRGRPPPLPHSSTHPDV